MPGKSRGFSKTRSATDKAKLRGSFPKIGKERALSEKNGGLSWASGHIVQEIVQKSINTYEAQLYYPASFNCPE